MACQQGKTRDEMVTGLKTIRKTHVMPRKKLGRSECQLVTFDLPYLAFYYNQKLMFYKGGDFEGMVAKLKDRLALVLEEFYQLAGKLGKDEEGVFRVEYDDNMEGVEVLEVAAEAVSVEELAADDGTTIFKDFIPYTGILNLEGLRRPLLAVQLTKLKDGLAIGCAFNHAILDGSSTWHFMSSWAQVCSGSPAVSARPFLDRTKARNTRVKLDLSLPSNPSAVPSDRDHTQSELPLRERIFRFSESAINKIKATINAGTPPDGSKPFSTFQALSVHIWRHVTKARGLKPEEVTVFTVFADCRNRVDPPMPETFFGNLIQAIFTGTAAGLLLANPPEFGAAIIQKAILAHDAKAIDERNKHWENQPKMFQYKDAGANCVAVGSSPRFKVYEVDFGWGRPEGVRSGTNNRFDGMVYLYQGKSGGRSIDVEISLEARALEKLQMDREFLEP
ncbi:hypothetical protein BT93_K2393 [Corymbia citriodora subsp. variegata]|nr:hypothetical protein BT93_K2393 [Corymbia citriodora subsp. variegata]